MAAYM